MSNSDSEPSDFDRPTEAQAPPVESAAEIPTMATGTRLVSGSAVPELKGFEFIEELGRGGMGVVFKARDQKLDRLVAVKMILGGKFASQEEIHRFRLEGEAAARLDHPGIVPIYEIGEADGNHFFSMKFIDGAPLSRRLDEYQSDSRRIAELMIKIARAVQHAHQRGVLHRDLKPANVLIDDQGTPLLTDLGLAKRMDGESDLTKSGLVMGTPGFMAPEQAAGKKDVTTAADVFSLGAILFWLTTGSAPFQGENALQIALKTIEGDTPTVRSLNPSADSDLELICQKAMHKDPHQRYSSAAALADDLQAWLDGELLSVRPPTALSLASIWIRKNLRTTLAACLSGVIFGVVIGMVAQMDSLRRVAAQEHLIQQLGGSARTWVDSVSGLRHMSPWWAVAQFLISPAVAVSALVCVYIVQPKNRETNIAVGLTTGIIATLVAFLIGVGWIVIDDRSVRSGAQDIHLLSTAVWLESDSERKLAQQALMQRYPGLESMDLSQRKQLVETKILHDQRTGLFPGLWLAVIVSIMIAGLPVAGSCMLSGMLWRRGLRSWQWVFVTWEHAAYFLVFVLILAMWTRAIVPGVGVTLVGLIGVATCLFFAIRDVRIRWRVLMIPVPFFAMGLVNMDIAKMETAPRDAGRAVSNQELRYQMELCDRLLDNKEISFVRYQAAVGWLYLGDQQAYQRHCKMELGRFENAYTPAVASRLAKVTMLRPDLQDEKTLPLLYSLSEYASSFESAEYIRWFFSTRALVEVRRGDYQAALDWNARSREDETTDSENGYRHGVSHAVDALALVHLGRRNDAEKSIGLGRQAAELFRDESMKDGIDYSWVDWLIFQIIEKEVLKELSEDPGRKKSQ